MKILESALEPTNGYIKSFIRNPAEGFWEVEVGLPISWVYDENTEIGCEVTFQNDIGKIVKIVPKNNDIVFDDLVDFVSIIIETNQRIAEKEKEFTDRMQEMKSVLEKEAKKFYEELDELKVNSFKNINESFTKSLRPEEDKKPKKTREKKEVPPSENTAMLLE